MRTRALLLTLSLAAMPLAGCDAGEPGTSSSSGASPTATTNGVDKQDAATALKSAKAAFLAAPTVHVKGSVVSEGSTITLDLHLGTGGRSRGTLTMDGATVNLLTTGKHAYISGDRKFWTEAAGAAAYSQLKGKYFKTKLTNKDFRDLVLFTDRTNVANGLLPPDRLAYDGQETIRGLRTVRFKDFSGGSYNVALDGQPYPVRLAGKDATDAGTLEFLDYGKAVDVSPPPAKKVIDADKLGS